MFLMLQYSLLGINLYFIIHPDAPPNENFLAASQSPIQLPGNRLDTKILLAKQPTTRFPLPKLKPRKPAFNAKVGVLHTPHMIGAPQRRRIPQQTKFNPKPRRHLFHHVRKK